jgi:hypothetical protein
MGHTMTGSEQDVTPSSFTILEECSIIGYDLLYSVLVIVTQRSRYACRRRQYLYIVVEVQEN